MARKLSPAVLAQITAALKERDELARERDELARQLAKAQYDFSDYRKGAMQMLAEADQVIKRLTRERNEARRLAEGRLAVAHEAIAARDRLRSRYDVRAAAANDRNLMEECNESRPHDG